jgi:hypothetical protein
MRIFAATIDPLDIANGALRHQHRPPAFYAKRTESFHHRNPPSKPHRRESVNATRECVRVFGDSVTR